ncbi:hypothetical protein HDU98_004206 [Podochytrium sp. JEL0797]|nr:hypothetical protein HDU98_004206 [Podochytrium sp. JEL0797]
MSQITECEQAKTAYVQALTSPSVNACNQDTMDGMVKYVNGCPADTTIPRSSKDITDFQWYCHERYNATLIVPAAATIPTLIAATPTAAAQPTSSPPSGATETVPIISIVFFVLTYEQSLLTAQRQCPPAYDRPHCVCSDLVLATMTPFFNACKENGEFDPSNMLFTDPQSYLAFCTVGGATVSAPVQVTSRTASLTAVSISTATGGAGANGGGTSVSTTVSASPTGADISPVPPTGVDAGPVFLPTASVAPTGTASKSDATLTASIAVSTTSTPLEPSAASLPLGIPIAAWAGIGIGALVVLLLVTLLLVRFCRRSKRERTSRGQNGDDSRDITGKGMVEDQVRASTLPRNPPRQQPDSWNEQQQQQQNHAAFNFQTQRRFESPPGTRDAAALGGSEAAFEMQQPSSTKTQNQYREPTQLIDLDDEGDVSSVAWSSQGAAPSLFDAVYSNPSRSMSQDTSNREYTFPTSQQQAAHRASMPYAAGPAAAVPRTTSFSNVYESHPMATRHMSMPPVAAVDFEGPFADKNAAPTNHRNSFAEAYGVFPSSVTAATAAPLVRPSSSLQQSWTPPQQQQPPVRGYSHHAVAPPTLLPTRSMQSDDIKDVSPVSMNSVRPVSFAEAYQRPINRDSFAVHRPEVENPFDDDVGKGGRRQSFVEVFGSVEVSGGGGGAERRGSFLDVYGR